MEETDKEDGEKARGKIEKKNDEMYIIMTFIIIIWRGSAKRMGISFESVCRVWGEAHRATKTSVYTACTTATTGTGSAREGHDENSKRQQAENQQKPNEKYEL